MDMEMRQIGSAPFDVAGEVLGATVNGLTTLEYEPVRPPYFSDSALRQAEQIVRALQEGVSEIRIERPGTELVLTKRLGENVRRILTPRGGMITSVEGRLYRIHLGRREFGVYDIRQKQAITCTYPDKMFEDVRKLLGQPVRVFGKARTDASGMVQKLETRLIQGMRPFEGRKSLEAVFGSDPEFTGAIDSVAYVRANRDE